MALSFIYDGCLFVEPFEYLLLSSLDQRCLSMSLIIHESCSLIVIIYNSGTQLRVQIDCRFIVCESHSLILFSLSCLFDSFIDFLNYFKTLLFIQFFLFSFLLLYLTGSFSIILFMTQYLQMTLTSNAMLPQLLLHYQSQSSPKQSYSIRKMSCVIETSTSFYVSYKFFKIVCFCYSSQPQKKSYVRMYFLRYVSMFSK